MHGNGDKKQKGWIPSERFEAYSGSNKGMLKEFARQGFGRDKPNTQLGSSSATSAGNSKGKS
ncbi:MAG: hypothetical protein LKM45_03820 [Wolbachia endosymbiont of Alcedoecus sp.]|nr:hypothetical protein [Wolbachia endosymbiont of Alcedoecus sp.]